MSPFPGIPVISRFPVFQISREIGTSVKKEAGKARDAAGSSREQLSQSAVERSKSATLKLIFIA